MADTRDQILDAARRLFLEQGYDKTSLREVADEVGVTKAALYYHFRSKEDLLTALLEPLKQAGAQFVDAITRDGAGAAGADDRLRWAAGLEGFIDWMLQNRELFELIEHNEVAITAISADDSDTDFAAIHQRFHDSIDAALGDGRVSLTRRVQLMCALGVAISFAHFGRPFDLEADHHEIRAATVDAMRATLGLLPAASTTSTPSATAATPA